MDRIGIIGNGVAAVTAIREIRSKNRDVAIDVFSDEKYTYYPRPKLIEYIAGRISKDEVIQYGHEWYDEYDVNLHLAEPVIEVIPSSLSILTEKQSYFNYDNILIAVGSHPFVPPIRGVEKERVHILRTLDDAIDISNSVDGAGREIIVGGGILGIELAAAMKAAGGNPIVISNISTLLPAQLDQGASNILLKRLGNMGITALLGFTCTEVTGPGHATGVVSTEGDKVKGDMVVMTTGIRPNTHLARQANIAVGPGKGILVDEYMQTTSDSIYAAGDCTEWKGICWGIIPVALETAKIAAINIMAHGSKKYDGTTPSNTLQVAGINLTSIGEFNPQSPEYESITSANESEGTYFKAVLKDDVMVGGISLGDRKVALKIRRMIRTKEIVKDKKKEIFDV
ncbi:NAD(P)/FAD-dependent oxidoreductase [Candidatus Thorarchaeota archaeon]|nr:MAG: NAD(P)/FAD-dependent oxidoreductase [Candidatus Thorarchaeota archaeon]